MAHLNLHNFIRHLTFPATVLLNQPSAVPVIMAYLGLGLLGLLEQLWQPLDLPLLIQLSIRLILSLPCSIIHNTSLDDLVSWQPLALTPDRSAALGAEEGGYAFAGVGDLVVFLWGSWWMLVTGIGFYSSKQFEE